MCFLMALSAIGCSNITVTEDNKSSGDNSSIPKDGIVSEEVFKELKDSGDMQLFNGSNDDFTYQWMFMGTDISTPRDLNLLVNPTSTDLETVKKEADTDKVYGFKFGEESSLDAKTALSIIYKDDLKCTAADIYQVENGKLKKITTATVETSEGTTFNFSLKDRKGEFYIVGSDPK